MTLSRCALPAIVLLSALPCAVGSPQAASPWQPDEPRYGFEVVKGLSVQMDDGVRLAADVYYPTDLRAGRRARGSFPVLLEQTPYGKDHLRALFDRIAGYFVTRGYIYAIADLRGFASSGGQAAWFGSRAGRDGARLTNWAGHLAGANGKVGLMGCSYDGVIQYFTASSLPPGSPVKALAPFCTDSNFYRDATAVGGLPTQVLAAVRALTARGTEDDPAADPFMQLIVSMGTGSDAYYSEQWESLNVTRMMPRIVELGIPVLSETGWYDLFPGGNIDAHVAAQNAAARRSPDQPLRAGTGASGRYQAIVGPWFHGERVGDALRPLVLEWFDTWLKGAPTGMADTVKPLHWFIVGADRWIDSATYPLTDRVRSFRLSPGSLNEASSAITCPESAPDTGRCSEPLLWAPAFEGESALTFTSQPLDAPLIIAGPGTVTVYLKSTRPEVELTATLFAVSSDEVETKISDGAQLGSQRALDPASSWYSSDGTLIRPSHYFTRDKISPVPLGQPVRLDIELTPAAIRIAPGQRLRLKLTSQPAPDFHQFWKTVQIPDPLSPTPEELTNLTGGIYTILYGGEPSSVVNLSIASDADIAASPIDWGPRN